MPPGLTRLAWRAGGVWVLAREALMPRRLGRVVLFAAAAAGAAWVAWPQPGVGHVAEGRFNAIAPVLVVAVLPLLSRRFFGPAGPSRIARSLRVLCYAAVLALLRPSPSSMVFSSLPPVQPAYLRIFCDDRLHRGCPARSSGGPTWQAEILIMLLIIGYVGVTLFLTSRRSQVTRSTLAIGTGTGLLFGVVMFAVDPLGLSNCGHQSVAAGLDGRPAGRAGLDPAVRRPGRGRRAGRAAVPRTRRRQAARQRQVRAGRRRRACWRTGLAAMFTTALGTGTTMLMLKSPWLLHWLNHGRHLTAFATYRYELNTDQPRRRAMCSCCMFFPVIGLIMSYPGRGHRQPRTQPSVHRVRRRSAGPEPGPSPSRPVTGERKQTAFPSWRAPNL